MLAIPHTFLPFLMQMQPLAPHLVPQLPKKEKDTIENVQCGKKRHIELKNVKFNNAENSEMEEFSMSINPSKPLAPSFEPLYCKHQALQVELHDMTFKSANTVYANLFFTIQYPGVQPTATTAWVRRLGLQRRSLYIPKKMYDKANISTIQNENLFQSSPLCHLCHDFPFEV